MSLGAAEDNEHREKAMHQEAGAQDVSGKRIRQMRSQALKASYMSYF